MEKRSCSCSSWVCTVVTQICLCLALYIALNLGQPHTLVNLNNTNANANANDDIYFMSVKGGYRPLITKQFHLLKMMDKVARDYKVSFVVCSSELGEVDPLLHNATHYHHFPSLRLLPWYTTSIASKSSSEGQQVGCFEKNIMMTNGKTLNLIGLDTQLLQDSILRGSRNNPQLHWLIRTLQQNGSNWRIFVGYQPLVICGQNREKMNNKKQAYYEYLHHLFRKFAVNVYLSGQDCTNHVTDGSSVAYIGNPGLIEKQPYSVFLNGKSLLTRDLTNGFLLHRVSSIQFATYYINLTGEVAFKTVLQQKGTEVM